jgi:NAD(P)-dependent dehydrogenase (short-subunit alcohol dehydrogenase family)
MERTTQTSASMPNKPAETIKTAIITGGSRGLGRNTAVNLARRGVDVIFTYHAKQQDAETVAREIEGMGRKAAAFQLNTGDTRAFDGFAFDLRKTLEKWGRERFDFLINNAGSGLDGSSSWTQRKPSSAAWRQVRVRYRRTKIY